MYEFNISKDMEEEKRDIIREVAVGKVVAHSCQTLIIKELKINVEQDRVVTTEEEELRSLCGGWSE